MKKLLSTSRRGLPVRRNPGTAGKKAPELVARGISTCQYSGWTKRLSLLSQRSWERPVSSASAGQKRRLASTPGGVKYRKDYSPPPFLIDKVDLDFDIVSDSHTKVTSRLQVKPNKGTKAGAPLILDGEKMQLLAVRVNGRPLSSSEYSVSTDKLHIHSTPLSADQFELITEVLLDPSSNTALEGLYKAGAGLYTQCEAEGFRRITYFLDRPDVLSKYTTTIRAAKEAFPFLLSNGNLVAEGSTETGRRWVKWEDPFPKPCYLFALVAGDLEKKSSNFVTRSGREVLLEFYVDKGNGSKVDHAMSSLKKSMRWDEEVYGLEYDLDRYMIVAVNDFNMGAMENKGLNVFNSKYVLASPATATDADFAGIETVIAHEYFHNWTGNRVTCRDWFQLSLKEGLTVFRDQQFSGDQLSPSVQRVKDVRLLQSHQFPEDAGPFAHPVRPESYVEMNNFYTSTVYNKGAEVVRMYHTLLGDDGFRKGMDLYFQRHDGQAVTCDDFRQAMADANGLDLTQFERWYLQAGTPEVQVSHSYSEEHGTFSLKLTQDCPSTPGQPGKEKKPFLLPVRMSLLDSSGKEMEVRLKANDGLTKDDGSGEAVLQFKEREQEFVFTGVKEKPYLSLFRDFSAPVKVKYDRRTDEELSFLMAHDTNPFNRWATGQEFATRQLMAMIQSRAEAIRTESIAHLAMDSSFLVAMQKTLQSVLMETGDQRNGADKHAVALELQLPSFSSLAEEVGKDIDPSAIHSVMKFARIQLAQFLRTDLHKVYRSCGGLDYKAEYVYEKDAVARRSLKNVCLDYLKELAGMDRQVLPMAKHQFLSAGNMTDTLAAFSAILNCMAAPQAVKDECVQAFYDKWHQDPLVLDKWFALQASADVPDAIEVVERLMSHKDFTLKNPNRARSVLSIFSMANPAHFHSPSGDGYRLLADSVLMLSDINPQVASQVVNPLLSWMRYEKARKELMHQELERIAMKDNLCADVREKVTKSLGQS